MIEKKRLELAAERETVVALRRRFTKISERRAGELVGVRRSSYRYQDNRWAKDEELTATLKTLALEQPRYGYRRLAVLVKRGSAEAINEKRIRWLYRLAGLALCKLKRKRIQRAAGGGYFNSERASDSGVRGGRRRIRQAAAHSHR